VSIKRTARRGRVDYLSDKNVKIRKPQKCWGCGREFKPGTKLTYVKAVDGGQFYSAYWCPVCQKYWIENMGSEDGINFGELKSEDAEGWESIRKSIEE
jgi:hypothetical protein